MKKILLGLFLILGAVSFSAPSHVNTAKIKSDGHTILDDKSDSYAFGERIDENSLLVVTYYVGELGPGGVKTVSETLNDLKEIINLGVGEGRKYLK